MLYACWTPLSVHHIFLLSSSSLREKSVGSGARRPAGQVCVVRGERMRRQLWVKPLLWVDCGRRNTAPLVKPKESTDLQPIWFHPQGRTWFSVLAFLGWEGLWLFIILWGPVIHVPIKGLHSLTNKTAHGAIWRGSLFLFLKPRLYSQSCWMKDLNFRKLS